VQQFAAALAGTAVLVPFARMPSKLGIRRGMSATYRLPIESPETGSQLPPPKNVQSLAAAKHLPNLSSQ
jgi:hypothetical protein